MLIPKKMEMNVVLSARPICLLNDVPKIFERVILDRMLAHMDAEPRSRLSGRQFGFREGRSTVDALRWVVEYVRRIVGRDHFAIAIGLDISNAFNSLPWRAIRWALARKGFPAYLRRVLDSYLHERFIEFPTCDGTVVRRPVTAGVPQGSVLGPFLWNITFDYVTEMWPLAACAFVCYADDTLVIGTASTLERARDRVNEQVVTLIRRMESIGLSIAPEKTEAVLFHGRYRPEFAPIVRVKGELIRVGTSMRYLGVLLDSRLTFAEHFRYASDKVRHGYQGPFLDSCQISVAPRKRRGDYMRML